MTITLPEDISEITLRHYIALEAIDETLSDSEKIKKQVEIFTGLTPEQLKGVSKKDFDEMAIQINIALAQDSEFKDRFELNGIEFGFIPNFDKITAGEWGDLNRYNTDTETLNRLMAILFRPIVKEDKIGNYKIEAYQGTDLYAETMLDAPLNILNGALVFFCNLAIELQNSIKAYSKVAQKRGEMYQSSTIGGAGIARFLNWLKEIYYALKKLLRQTYTNF